MLKFHLDEHVATAVSTALRAHGIDVSTSKDTQLLGSNDRDQMAHALSKGRVIVTHDHDFLRRHAGGVSHAGIAYCHQDKYPIGELLQLSLMMDACYATKDMVGRVEYL